MYQLPAASLNLFYAFDHNTLGNMTEACLAPSSSFPKLLETPIPSSCQCCHCEHQHRRTAMDDFNDRTVALHRSTISRCTVKLFMARGGPFAATTSMKMAVSQPPSHPAEKVPPPNAAQAKDPAPATAPAERPKNSRLLSSFSCFGSAASVAKLAKSRHKSRISKNEF